jgi:hypothetical protein
MECSYCSHDELRSSRLRLSDVFQLLIFRVPMRCSHCHFRQFENVVKVHTYKKNRRAQRRAA